MCVFGAGGFVGRALVTALRDAGYSVVLVVRQDSLPSHGNCEVVVVPDLDNVDLDWNRLLGECKTVFNLVGAAHTGSTDYQFYYSSNVATAMRIAEICKEADVDKLVHVSSIKAVAKSGRVSSSMEKTAAGNPDGLYGLTKSFAEIKIEKFLKSTNVGLTICRLPLIYGPNVKGNLRIIKIYLRYSPFFIFRNCLKAREMMSLSNCCRLLIAASEIKNQKGSVRCYNFTDGGKFAVSDLEQIVFGGRRLPPFKLGLSLKILGLIFRFFNRLELYEKLTEDVEVDSESIKQLYKLACVSEPCVEIKRWLEH